MNSEKEKKFAAKLSIISNSLIVAIKFIAGIISGSISIISEAVHSLSDLLASIITYFAIMRSSQKADKEHPFGHGRYEDVSGFIEGLLIIFAAFYIFYESYKKIVSIQNFELDSTLSIYVMGIAIVANMLVSGYLYKIAKNTDSVALYADAKHLGADVYSSLGVFIGLILIKITGITLLDPLIAIFVALMVLKTGVNITKETFNNLVDGTLPQEDLNQIEDILNNCEEINGYTDIKTRKTGPNRDIDITLFCDGNISLKECHLICDKIETQIKNKFLNTQITIHCEPYENK